MDRGTTSSVATTAPSSPAVKLVFGRPRRQVTGASISYDALNRLVEGFQLARGEERDQARFRELATNSVLAQSRSEALAISSLTQDFLIKTGEGALDVVAVSSRGKVAIEIQIIVYLVIKRRNQLEAGEGPGAQRNVRRISRSSPSLPQVSPDRKRQRAATSTSTSTSIIASENSINDSSGSPVISGQAVDLASAIGTTGPLSTVNEDACISARDPLALSNIQAAELYPEAVAAYALMTCKGSVASVVFGPFVDVFDRVAGESGVIDLNQFFLSTKDFARSSLSFSAGTAAAATSASASAPASATSSNNNIDYNSNIDYNRDQDYNADLVEALAMLDDIGPSLDAEAARQPWNLFPECP